MNRYEWLIWIFRLLINSENVDGIRVLVRELMAIPDMSGPEKREEVEKEWLANVREALPAALKEGAVYLIRALIELTLAKKNGG